MNFYIWRSVSKRFEIHHSSSFPFFAIGDLLATCQKFHEQLKTYSSNDISLNESSSTDYIVLFPRLIFFVKTSANLVAKPGMF